RDPACLWERPRMTTSVLIVNHLRCEHRRNPLGIVAAWPMLSWVLESERVGSGRYEFVGKVRRG
ncbi:MAG TPA: hypothetical protein VGP38_04390, partial [Rubrobacter sp.]|nr:hypothetical protein [Rubrobacter sp.]